MATCVTCRKEITLSESTNTPIGKMCQSCYDAYTAEQKKKKREINDGTRCESCEQPIGAVSVRTGEKKKRICYACYVKTAPEKPAEKSTIPKTPENIQRLQKLLAAGRITREEFDQAI